MLTTFFKITLSCEALFSDFNMSTFLQSLSQYHASFPQSPFEIWIGINFSKLNS